MLRHALILMAITLLTPGLSTVVSADENGIVKKQSMYSVKETLDRLENILKAKGIGIAVRWNHSEKAKAIGMELRDTEILIFGNPKMGSPLMMSNQEIGIDLPLKALAYKDASGQVWLAYNDPAYLKHRHGITDKDNLFEKMSAALKGMTDKATAK